MALFVNMSKCMHESHLDESPRNTCLEFGVNIIIQVPSWSNLKFPPTKDSGWKYKPHFS